MYIIKSSYIIFIREYYTYKFCKLFQGLVKTIKRISLLKIKALWKKEYIKYFVNNIESVSVSIVIYIYAI